MSTTATLPPAEAGAGRPQPAPQRLTLPIGGMTCHSCIGRVRSALESIPGVHVEQVSVGSARVLVSPSAVSILSLKEAVLAAGYVPGEPADPSVEPSSSPASPVQAGTQARSYSLSPSVALAGIAGSLGLLAFYAGIMGIAQGFDSALGLLREDWYLFTPLVLGFGVQVALFAYLRRLHRVRGRSTGAVTGASAGISGLSMLACCVHHLAELVPLVGLSGLALVLGEYRQPLMILGILSNLAGIAFMARMVPRGRDM